LVHRQWPRFPEWKIAFAPISTVSYSISPGLVDRQSPRLPEGKPAFEPIRPIRDRTKQNKPSQQYQRDRKGSHDIFGKRSTHDQAHPPFTPAVAIVRERTRRPFSCWTWIPTRFPKPGGSNQGRLTPFRGLWRTCRVAWMGIFINGQRETHIVFRADARDV